MKKIKITQQEIWDATKPKIEKNKKKYDRKKQPSLKPKDVNKDD